MIEVEVGGGDPDDAVGAIFVRIANRESEPAGIGLGADDDKLLDLEVLQHAPPGLGKREMKVERGRGAELERLQHFHAALRTALENEAAPARHLPLPNARPTAPKIRAREINQIPDGRGLRAEKANPSPNDERAGAVNDDVEAVLEQIRMLLEQSAVEGARDVRDRDRVVERDVAREVDLHHVVALAQAPGQVAVDVGDRSRIRGRTFRAVTVNQDDRFHRQLTGGSITGCRRRRQARSRSPRLTNPADAQAASRLRRCSSRSTSGTRSNS